VDESFQPLIKAEKAAFEENYHFAKLNLVFKPENESMRDSFIDLSNYAVIAMMVLDNNWDTDENNRRDNPGV
jgi:phosphate transport system substrate-binding protein